MSDKSIRFTPPYCDKGFTLAEVLIALVVIGIIAAITMTTVMPNIQERINSERQANIVYKITQATDLMKANGALVDGFASTDAFVDELQKYLKIMKRCDSEHIAECWPTKKVRTSEGKEYEVKDAKTRNQLGISDKYKSNKNVGIVLNDGASIIMTYNPAHAGMSITEEAKIKTTNLPVGGKFQTILEYTTDTTGGLAFVMDVNGGKGPNSETIDNKMYDIRNLNGAHFSTGCGGTVYNGKCYTVISSPSKIYCADENRNKYCNNESKNIYSKWAGGKSDCDALGGSMPNYSTLRDICQNSELTRAVGLENFSGWLWTTTYASSYMTSGDSKALNMIYLNFPSCSAAGISEDSSMVQILCIEK